MANMTAEEVITAAYRKNGIKSITTQQKTDGLQDLQNMLSSWSADGLSVPSLTTESFTLISGQAVYTIGSGGDFDTVRPNRIISAYIRVSNDDYPVQTDMTEDEYNKILSKDSESRPRRLYYDPQYPLGKIKFDYEADTTYAFTLISEKPLTNPSALSTTFSIPLEYNRALVYNLAIEFAPDNDNKLTPEVYAVAQESKQVIENINAVDRMNSGVTLDSAVVYNTNAYNLDITTGE